MLLNSSPYKIERYQESSGSLGLPSITHLQLCCHTVLEALPEATQSTTKPKIISGCSDN